MLKNRTCRGIISIILATVIFLQPMMYTLVITQMTAVQRARGWPDARVPTLHAQEPEQNDSTIYLPVVAKDSAQATPTPSATPPVGNTPSFQITSPLEQQTVSGYIFFAVQPLESAAVTSVSFKAGDRDLGRDTNGSDGFKIFVNTRDLPAGITEFSATATGPNGSSTQTVSVDVVATVPTSASIGQSGGVLASEIGSIISILPGSVPDGTTITVDELTQAETTARLGIDWDALGVTFLGAQDVQSSVPFSRPFGMVASAGFGNRVQPGQTVVNYRIAPDADGDGASEIVVVNTASVAPNGDVLADPIPQAEVGTVEVISILDSSQVQAAQEEIRVLPGAILEIVVSGFNPNSVYGNRAQFRSAVDNSTYDLAGSVYVDANDGSVQIFSIMVPPLPPGRADLTLLNQSTGNNSVQLSLIVEQSPSLDRSADAIIADFFTRAQQFVSALLATAPPEVDAAQVQDAFAQAETFFTNLQNDSSPTTQQFLNDFATMIVNSGALVAGTGLPTDAQVVAALFGRCFDPKDDGFFGGRRGFKNSTLILITALGIAAVVTGGTAGVAIGVITVLAGAEREFLDTNTPDCKEPPPCDPTQSNPPGPTGMGAAPPPGGPGCGGAAGGDGGLVAAGYAQQNASPIMVKILSNGSFTPFTGMTDAGGYFFVPFIPAGEPFTALAIDTGSGQTRRFVGTGPATGASVFMLFDFYNDDGSGATPINIGDVISNTIGTAGEIDLYSFVAAAGEQIFFDLQTVTGLNASMNWSLLAPDGTKLFDTCVGCGDPGLQTLTLPGTYILSVGETNDTSTGSYRVQLWDVPTPQEFTIAVGDTIADGNPGAGAGNIETPGVRDVYRFTGVAGQQVYIDTQASAGIESVNWRMVDETGAELFSTCLGCGDPGVQPLTQGGIYTITVGEDRDDSTGTYRFQVWNVPAPQHFAITVGDIISDGVPGPGGGNIESPGVRDHYRFTATAGQQVFVDAQGNTDVAGVNWTLVDGAGAELFSTCLGCGDPGVQTLTQGGTYTITVGENRDDSTGTYRFQVWNVPAPHEFTIAIGDVISNGVPGPGAGAIESPGVRDLYRFTATAGQQIFVDGQGNSGVNSVNWRMVDEAGTEVFSTCLGCGEPGVQTLTRGGTYLLTVGEDRDDSAGTYRFQLWNVPAPQEFTIAIGDIISNGVPGAGAGNIETPGAHDIYRMTATVGQQVFIDSLENSGLGGIDWRMVDEAGTEVFSTCLGCGDPGARTLTRGGTYTITVGDHRDDRTGTYRFQIRAQ